MTLFFTQEGDGAKPKALSSQKLSPKWCFLDGEYLSCGGHWLPPHPWQGVEGKGALSHSDICQAGVPSL